MSNINKILDKIIERQIQSFRIDANFRKKVLKDLKQLESELIKRLNEIDFDGSFEFNKLRSLIKSIPIITDETYQQIDEEFKEYINEYVVLESNSTNKILNSVLGVKSSGISIKELNKIYTAALIEGAPSSEWWSRQSKKTQNAFIDTVREGLALGENNFDLVKRIRGTKQFNYTNGIMEVSRKDAESLVRSSVQAVSNEIRSKTFKENDDILDGYQHISTLDSRTSDTCVVRDGLKWDLDFKPINHQIPFKRPPLHWNCRSVLVPIIKDFKLSKDATRASVSGPVPANFTFNDFLKNKSSNFQNDLLGKGKAELYRSGKITLRQLLDQSGNPLTLKELKQKYL